jgi:ribosome-binding factor A
MNSKVSDVKKERRKALFLREITSIIQQLASDEPAVTQVYVSNVDISANSGIVYVYFSAYMEPGQEIFDKALAVLKLYKPSIRKAFAQQVQTRYAPDLVFVFDKAKERERRVNDLLEKVSSERIDGDK